MHGAAMPIAVPAAAAAFSGEAGCRLRHCSHVSNLCACLLHCGIYSMLTCCVCVVLCFADNPKLADIRSRVEAFASSFTMPGFEVADLQ